MSERPRLVICEWCEDEFEVADMGPIPKFCKASHRQRAYEFRRGVLTRKSFYDDVKEFHVVFRLPVGDATNPAFTSTGDQGLRMRLIDEEVLELREAHYTQDIVEAADAIADCIYVLCGMAVSYGIPLNEVFAEVQRSNMAKVGENGPVYREDGKVSKPEGWTPPDIAGVLDRIRKGS